MDKSVVLHVCLASDENYAPHLATNMISIIENNKTAIIVFHILDGGITDESRNKLNTIQDKYDGVKCIYYSVTDDFIRNSIDLPELYHDRSLTAYARIFIPELLDSSISRCVYLDCDGVVVGSLLPLFMMQMDYEVYGVQDVISYDKRKAIGLNVKQNYICSGMMLFDLEKCRKNCFTERCLSFIRERNGNVVAMDQGTINGVYNGEIGILHPKYNVMTPFYELSSKELALMANRNRYYSDRVLLEAIANPVFIHYTPAYTTRPWQMNCSHPEKMKYLYYRNKSEFKLNTYQKDKRKAHVKILSYLYYHVSYPTFNKLLVLIKKYHK